MAASDDAASGEQPCDLVTVPAREGLEAVDILRLRHRVGPVLHDREGDTLGFLVPPGTAEGWDLPGSACTQTFGAPPRGKQPPVSGSGWLVPPGGATGDTTEPDRLRAALREAVTLLRAVDRCQ
ncbi:hypothetical protein RM780_12575 [Streptomyces sp. DSM 44917]|uniref:Uncharacterized protein n=1 Tax=Streptomyces boetiae TaxID=3075541 RepID=A0ABU2L8X9_9ACTN|nr:hypothetical protein [Streptomyces sp. DSM 44917]MDT0307792.1 hypothetical protein [Streptomyces sp. DSM 44917]